MIRIDTIWLASEPMDMAVATHKGLGGSLASHIEQYNGITKRQVAGAQTS